MDLTVLPAVNAVLNAVATGLLVTGWVLIRHRRVRAHRATMIAAFATSTLFLVSYLIYHYVHGTVTRFPEELGWIRVVYLAILATHIVLAMVVAPGALWLLWLALRRRFERHRAAARWLLPIWLYVSVTGVIIYVMLYHVAPGL